MTKDEKQKRLNENYARYLREAEELKAQGKGIGTFSSWQFANKLVTIKIATTRESHFRSD